MSNFLGGRWPFLSLSSALATSRLRQLPALALTAIAVSGFVACSDSNSGPSEGVATTQEALSGNPDPVVRYWFNEASGTQASDSSGNGYSATLQNGASFVAGARSNAVRIAGGTQRVALPAGVVGSCDDLTIAARVKLATNASNWARIFDIGTGTNSYLFLTPRAGASNLLRFGITNAGGAGEQQLNSTFSFPTNTWKHVAVVLSGNTGTMYLDGAQVAQNTNLTLNPSALGATVSNWLGDSQYAADPTLDGTIDDFLVSCRPYSASEIAWLAAGTDPVALYSFNEPSGTTAADSSGNARNATLANGASFVTGLNGNALRIAGGTQRVNLPTGIVQSCSDLTIGAHVRLTTNGADWARIFDIGASTTSYMFLSPRAGASNTLRFGITTAGNAAEQRLSFTYSFPTNTWKHVAVVLSGNTGRMYLDGVQVAQNTSMTLDPSALGATVNNFLGDSQFAADPTLDGTIDNLLISCRAFSPTEIGALAGACTSSANCNDGNSCTTDTCASGFCTHAAAANGTSCPDGNLCNGGETCQSGFCSAGTPPVVDDGNACTTDSCDAVQGVTHTPVTGGACGGGGGLGGAGGIAGSGGRGGASGGGSGGSSGAGSGGTSGTGGAGSGGCPSGTTAVEYFIELPNGVHRDDVVLGNYGPTQIDVHDGVTLLEPDGTFASLASVYTPSAANGNAARLGVQSNVQDVYSEPNVVLADHAHVHGNILTPGPVTRGAGSLVDGGVAPKPLAPHVRESWNVCFPNQNAGNIDVQPGMSFPADGSRLMPGAYGSLAVKTGARIRLRGAATYYFESIAIEPGGILDLDNAAGGVLLYFRNGGFYRGQQARTDTLRANVLFAVANGGLAVGSSMRGTVVVPRGVLDLPTMASGHQGSFFANTLVAHQTTNITHEPLDTETICDPLGPCDGLCTCGGGAPGGCKTDGDCGQGLVCALGQGPRFSGAVGTNACMPPDCFERLQKDLSCGSVNNRCGACDVPPRPCATASDCVAGESCTTGNGALFGLGVPSVCWPTVCTTAAGKGLCGGPNAPCGVCQCATACAGKTCGGDMSNGCGGDCEGICADRQPGCTSDAQCASGSVCVKNGGPRVGQPEGTNVCLPKTCKTNPGPALCGSPSSTCGTCPICTPNCTGRCGGPDGCGGVCPSTCAEGQTCFFDTCTAAPDASGVDIPDGLGNTRSVGPIDPGPTEPVGALDGVFGVSDTGKATYRIPIAVPPGRMGVQPALSLTYGGTQRNGLLGVGWHLEGLSTISRCRHTGNRDGFSAPIADDRTDRYCIDGVQIVGGVEGQGYGEENVLHFPEFDPRTRIYAFGTSPQGPAYFKVWRSNGLIYTYGRSDLASVFSDPGVKREWALERVEDRVGNYMTITYAKAEDSAAFAGAPTQFSETVEFVPWEIAYGGFDGPGAPPLVPSRFVTLQYDFKDNRPDTLITYSAGHQVARRARLLGVVASVKKPGVSPSRLVSRTYRITYGDQEGHPTDSRVSLIRSIKECGGNGICKPETRFDYYDHASDSALPAPGGTQFFSQSASTGVFLKGMDKARSSDPFPPTPFLIGRARHAGRVDDIFYGFGFEITEDEVFGCDLPWWVPFSSCSHLHFHVPMSGWETVRGGEHLPLFATQLPFLSNHGRLAGVGCGQALTGQANLEPLGDFDLDGHDDLIDTLLLDGGRPRWLSGAPGAAGPQPIAIDPPLRCGPRFPGVIVDLTGDGVPDAVTCRDLNTGRAPRLRERLSVDTFAAPVALPSRTEEFTSGGSTLTTAALCEKVLHRTEDIDGDGTQNLLADRDALLVRATRVDVASPTWVTTGMPIGKDLGMSALVPVDLNGDGLLDRVFVFFSCDSDHGLPCEISTHVLLNTGRGFARLPTALTLTGQQLRKAIVADVNHDGKQELVMPVVTEIGPLNRPPNVWQAVGLSGDDLEVLASFDTGVPMSEGTIASQGAAEIPAHVSLMADVNGDGADDLVLVVPDSKKDPPPEIAPPYVIPSFWDNGLFYVLYGRGTRANLLKSVTDGVGKRIEVKWDRVQQGNPVVATYEPGTSCFPARCDGHVQVVSEHSVGQLVDNLSVRPERLFTYTYKDGRTDPADQKFLGFAERSINEFAGNATNRVDAKTTTTITFDSFRRPANFTTYPFSGRRKHVRVVGPPTTSALAQNITTQRVIDTDNSWNIKSGFGEVFAELSSRQSSVSELTSSGDTLPISSVTESFLTDSFANVTSIKRNEFGASPSVALLLTETTIHFLPVEAFNQGTSSWLIALPSDRATTETVLTSPQEQKTRFSEFKFETNGQLKEVTREPNRADLFLRSTFIRDGYGNVETVVESALPPNEKRQTSVTYDAEHIFPATISRKVGVAAGGSPPPFETSYVAFDRRFGSPILAADPNGVFAQWAYDAFGRVKHELTPETESLTFYKDEDTRTTGVLPSYGAFGVATETAGYGKTEVGLDAFGREVRRSSTGLLGDQVESETLYDANAFTTEQSRPHKAGSNQGTVLSTRDGAGRLRTLRQADGTTVQMEYASRATAGNPAPELGALRDEYCYFTRATNPRGKQSLSIADHRGRTVASGDTGSAWVTTVPGVFGTVRSVTAARSAIAAGATSTYALDEYGRTLETVDADRGRERYSYTPWGEVDHYVIGSSTTPDLDYDYDPAGRVRTITSGQQTATYTYGTTIGEIGLLTDTVSLDGTERHLGYEQAAAGGRNRGLLTSVTDVIEGESFTTELHYNDIGQLDRTTYPGPTPFIVDRGYDGGGNLEAVGRKGPDGGFAEIYWQLLASQEGYLPAQEQIGPARTDHFYEPATGRLRDLTTQTPLAGVIQQVQHRYDPNGNLQFRDDFLETGEARNETFTYDDRDRLTDVTLGAATVATHVDYTPDGSGNIQSLTGTGTYSYNPVVGRPAHMPSNAGNVALTFDPRGTGNVSSRVASGSIQTYAHDAYGMATRIGVNGDPNAVVLKYRTSGVRAAKLLSDGRRIVYSGAYERETTSTGAVEHRYRIFGSTGEVGEIVRSDSGAELSRTYWLRDFLGSPVVITGAAGNVLHRQKFDAFGNSDNPTWVSSNPAVRRVRRGFTGHEHDPETGLVNMVARLYDPATARFMTPDPLTQAPGWAASLNRFAYAWNNPVNFVDPTGLIPTPCIETGTCPEPIPDVDPSPARGPAADTVPFEPASSLGEFSPSGGPALAAPPPAPLSEMPQELRLCSYGTCVAEGGEADPEEKPEDDVLEDPEIVEEEARIEQQRRIERAPTGRQLGAPPDTIDVDPAHEAKEPAAEEASEEPAAIDNRDGLRALKDRADEIHWLLDPRAQNGRTTGILRTEEDIDIVASGKRDLYPVQRQALGPREIEARWPGSHAETTALRRARELGLTPAQLATSRMICPQCARALLESGGTQVGPYFFVWTK